MTASHVVEMVCQIGKAFNNLALEPLVALSYCEWFVLCVDLIELDVLLQATCPNSIQESKSPQTIHIGCIFTEVK